MDYFNDPEFQERLRGKRREWKFKTYALWRDGLRDVFGGDPPQTAQWKEPAVIADVLNKAVDSSDPESGSRVRPVHAYLLFPDSGDSPLHGAEMYSEKKTIILQDKPFQDGGYVLRPETLHFQAPNGNLRFAYFWIDAAQLAPTGAYSEEHYEGNSREELCEYRPGQYVRPDQVHDGTWLNEEGEREYLSDRSRKVTRYLEGPFVVCCKINPYKLVNPDDPEHEPVNGAHAKIGRERFRKLIESVSTSDQRADETSA